MIGYPHDKDFDGFFLFHAGRFFDVDAFSLTLCIGDFKKFFMLCCG